MNASRVVKEKALLNVGVTFQNGALFDSLKIWENITFKDIRSYGYDIVELKNKALAIIQNLGLSESVLDLYPSELSGGMQKELQLPEQYILILKFYFLMNQLLDLTLLLGKL